MNYGHTARNNFQRISADDISIVLSFTDTNDERIEEAVDELQERRLRE